MRDLKNKVAWITGAGSGIGAGAALALGGAGMRLVLSGRREAELNKVAAQVVAAGGQARVAVLDVANADAAQAVADGIAAQEGRLDLLLNSAGLNIKARNWKHLQRDAWDEVLNVDLNGTFYTCHAVLPMMRAQRDGLIVNAMTESLNIEEGRHGIRATAMCPGEVATPILDKRPIPVSAEDRARMVQSDDCGELVLFLARLPAHVCINDVTISPTWNRAYVAQAATIPA